MRHFLLAITLLCVNSCVNVTSNTTIPDKPRDPRVYNISKDIGCWVQYDNYNNIVEVIRLEKKEFFYYKNDDISTGYWYTESERKSSDSLVFALCDEVTLQFIEYIVFEYYILTEDKILLNGEIFTTYIFDEKDFIEPK
jgi:hypothetical protein